MKMYKYISLALCVIAYMQTLASETSFSRKHEKTKSEKNGSSQIKESDEMQQRPGSPPKAWHSMAAGTAAGLIEVGVGGHALSYGINRSIQGERFTLNRLKWPQQGYMSLQPKNVYRGIEATAAGMAGITALQMMFNSQAQKLYQSQVKRELTDREKLVPAFFAGVAGASVATPQEGIPNYQQNVTQQENRALT